MTISRGIILHTNFTVTREAYSLNKTFVAWYPEDSYCGNLQTRYKIVAADVAKIQGASATLTAGGPTCPCPTPGAAPLYA